MTFAGPPSGVPLSIRSIAGTVAESAAAAETDQAREAKGLSSACWDIS